MSLLERFWAKVDASGPGCWEWHGARNSAGYGHIRIGRRNVLAHRLVLTLRGEDGVGAIVLHSCDNPACVRPDHLRIGTHGDNARDMYTKGRGGDRASQGEKNGRARLTADVVRAIRVHASMGVDAKSLARVFGVHPSVARDAINRVTWKTVQ